MPFFTTIRRIPTRLTNTTKTDTMTPAMIPACESLQFIKIIKTLILNLEPKLSTVTQVFRDKKLRKLSLEQVFR
jgi:hypothetical protein